MGDFMPIIYINYNLYYYGGFRAPNCLMTFVTHDTRDLPPPEKKSKKSWGFIRRPQWECCTFVLSIRNTADTLKSQPDTRAGKPNKQQL